MSLRRITSYDLAIAARDMRVAPPALVSGGRYQVGAIMRAAVMLARFQLRTAGTWRVRMKLALRHIWAKAKREMAASLAPTPVLAPSRLATVTPRRPAPGRGYGWDSSRRTSHGW